MKDKLKNLFENLSDFWSDWWPIITCIIAFLCMVIIGVSMSTSGHEHEHVQVQTFEYNGVIYIERHAYSSLAICPAYNPDGSLMTTNH